MQHMRSQTEELPANYLRSGQEIQNMTVMYEPSTMKNNISAFTAKGRHCLSMLSTAPHSEASNSDTTQCLTDDTHPPVQPLT